MPDNSKYDTVILRFRDLTAPTIEEHRSIITKHGYVWWGWWNKGKEQISYADFYWLAGKSRVHGLDIYLFDSASYKVYKAHCIDVYFLKNDEKSYSPEREKTPVYYSGQKYFAWFMFDSIEDSVFAELSDFKYVYSDGLFVETYQRLQNYNAHVIDSDTELMEQATTVWFIRNGSRPNYDEPHEILSKTLNKEEQRQLFGKVLKICLNSCHVSQEEAAEAIEVSTGSMSGYVRGTKIPRGKNAKSLLRFLVDTIDKNEDEERLKKGFFDSIYELDGIGSFLPTETTASAGFLANEVLQNILNSLKY